MPENGRDGAVAVSTAGSGGAGSGGGAGSAAVSGGSDASGSPAAGSGESGGAAIPAGSGGSGGTATAGIGGSGGTAPSGGSGGGGGETSRNPELAACPGSTNHSPGSRLRPYVIASEEGDRTWRSWYDIDREESCHFSLAADGQFRCLPVYESSEEGQYRCLPQTRIFIWRVFTDATCTEPAAFLVPDECSPTDFPPYFVRVEGDCNDQQLVVWELGETVAASELPPLWRKGEASCDPASSFAEQYVELIPTDPAHADYFVGGEFRVE